MSTKNREKEKENPNEAQAIRRQLKIELGRACVFNHPTLLFPIWIDPGCVHPVLIRLVGVFLCHPGAEYH